MKAEYHNKDLQSRRQGNLEYIALESLPCGVCRIAVDDHFTILYANSRYYEMYGYTREQAKAEGFDNVRFIIYPPDYRNVIEQIREFFAEGTFTFQIEYRACHKSGELRWTMVCCREEDCDLNWVSVDITDRKNMEEKLRMSAQERKVALESTDKLVDVYDVVNHTLTQSPAAAKQFGLPEVVERVPYSMVELGLVSEENQQEFIDFFEAMQKGIPSGEAIFKLKYGDGIWHWRQVKYTLIYGRFKNPKRAILLYEDITEQREKEIAYQKWELYFHSKKATGLGYYEYNLTKNIFVGSEQDFPQNLPEYIKSFTDAVHYFTKHYVYEEDIPQYLRFYNRERLLMCFYSGKDFDAVEYRRRDEKGEPFWVRGNVQLIPDPYTEEVKAFILVQDINKEKMELLKLQERSQRDPLTGLMNRGFMVRMADQIMTEHKKGRLHSFIILDIDYFKRLNDTYGHQFGDQVLKEFAAALEANLREGDLCGRLGGDEFVVLMRDVVSAESVEQRLKDLCCQMKNDYGTHSLVSVSAGMACFPEDGENFEELYEKADEALYEAKRRGRSQYAVYRK